METVDLLIYGKPLWMWGVFLSIIIALLVLDLGVLQKKSHEIGTTESLILSGFYIALASVFGAWVWYYLGETSGKEYFTGFIIEKSLSLDNIFVISLVFSYFQIPKKYQHGVLFWGILGVIIFRAVMIAVGAALLAQFSWVLYVFALFLIYTGFKMFVATDEGYDIENNPVLKFMRKYIRITSELHGKKFFIRQSAANTKESKKQLWATPLFVALMLIEFIDLIFAIDSVPAIFAITQDPYIVYTSNIFAILGLRALYFALAALITQFHYLKPALAFVLIFIGGKVFVADILRIEKIPAGLSLGITLGLILGGVILSLIYPKKIN
jgi:tellurite resistance protein TerC